MRWAIVSLAIEDGLSRSRINAPRPHGVSIVPLLAKTRKAMAGSPVDDAEVEVEADAAPESRSTCWTKIVLLAIAMQLASVGIIAGLTWVIVQHHKEVNVVAGLLVAQGDPRARPVATSAAVHEWGLQHIRLLTVQQLLALQTVRLPRDGPGAKVYHVRGVDVHTPEGSAEHALVVLHTATGDELHVRMAPGANATGSTYTFEGGLTTPPFTARARWPVSTCTIVAGTRYPLSGGRDGAWCPSTLSVAGGSDSQQRVIDTTGERRRLLAAGANATGSTSTFEGNPQTPPPFTGRARW